MPVQQNRAEIAIPADNYTAAPEQFMKRINNPNFSSIDVILTIAVLTATQTVQLVIEGFDEGSKTWYTLLASAAIAATGQTVLTVDPQGTASATQAKKRLPLGIRIRPVHGNILGVTYSVGYNLML